MLCALCIVFKYILLTQKQQILQIHPDNVVVLFVFLIQ